MQHHITVLKSEAVDGLALTPSSYVIDATFGAGGHAAEITSRLDTDGYFIGIDADESAVREGQSLSKGTQCTSHVRLGNFRDIASIAHECTPRRPDAILADLGWRMEQFSGNGKGFSFQLDEPLIMTYGDPKEYPFIAQDIVNEWSYEHIVTILRSYGEESFAPRIARSIIETREKTPILTTQDLVEVVTRAIPERFQHKRIHPATKTFQALRITVNDEWSTLETFITDSLALLHKKGRLAIISFHSIEDRLVKQLFRSYAESNAGTIITRRPITPSPEEISQNPRARSAKLRIFQKS